MKEIIHFTMAGSTVCKEMQPIIDKLIQDNPDIKYTTIDVFEDDKLYLYYSKKYSMNTCPSFLGLVDGKVMDGHVGSATQLILESLVN
jgi:thiol-disulfide isomerase/thioredoxin